MRTDTRVMLAAWVTVLVALVIGSWSCSRKAESITLGGAVSDAAALILAMEDEARWMIKNGLTTAKQTPDFSKYIYTDGLKAVKPEAVSIIR